MKNSCFLFLLLILAFQVPAQNIVPPFAPRTIQLTVPSFLPGLARDPAATVQNDTLFYNLNGMLFKSGYRIGAGSQSLELSTPFETLLEMVDAYAKRDKNRIVNLYSGSSAEQIKSLMNGPEGVEFLSYVHSIAIGTLDLLGVVEYKEGYLTFVKDHDEKVHINYIVKDGAAYKLAVFNDNQPTSWNLNVFFNTSPLPMIPLRTTVRKDSLATNDSVMVQVTVPSNTAYVALYTKSGEAARLIVEDNGKGDLNLTKNRVSFYVPGYLFPKAGDNTFYLAAFNYPVTYISSNFLVKAAEHSIKVYQ